MTSAILPSFYFYKMVLQIKWISSLYTFCRVVMVHIFIAYHLVHYFWFSRHNEVNQSIY